MLHSFWCFLKILKGFIFHLPFVSLDLKGKGYEEGHGTTEDPSFHVLIPLAGICKRLGGLLRPKPSLCTQLTEPAGDGHSTI